jgi:hypothetical protein
MPIKFGPLLPQHYFKVTELLYLIDVPSRIPISIEAAASPHGSTDRRWWCRRLEATGDEKEL